MSKTLFLPALNTSEQRSILSLNTFSLTLAVTFTLAYVYLTKGIATVISAEDVAKSLGFASFLLFFPQALATARGGAEHPTYWEAFVTVIILLSLTLLGSISNNEFVNGLVQIPILAAGLISPIIVLVRASAWPSLKTALTWAVLLPIFGVFSIWVVSIAWGSAYQTPVFFEQITDNQAHIDTLFHATLASMIKTLGLPSTGVDGTPYHYYHWGSHWIFASLSNILDIHPLAFYNVSYQIIFIPLFFKALGLFSLALRKVRGIDLNIGIPFFLILVIAVVSFPSEEFQISVAVWVTHQILSESYSVSLSSAFLFSAVAIHAFSKDRERTTEIATIIIAIPIMIGLVGLTKVSVMVLIAGAYLYWLLRKGILWKRNYLVSAVFTILSVLLILSITRGKGRGVEIEYFSFILNHVREGKEFTAYFFIYHYLWLWVYLALVIVAYRIYSFRRLGDLLRNRRLVEAEILLAVGIAGFIPGAVFALPGGATFYFSDVQKWLAIPLVLAILPAAFTSAGLDVFLKERKDRRQLLIGLTIAALVSIVLTRVLLEVYPNIRQRTSDLVWEYAKYKSGYKRESNLDLLEARSEILTELLKLSQLSIDSKKNSCIYIPKTNTVYWGLLKRPGATPLIAPAVTGIPMIYGLPIEEPKGRGYHRYAFPAEAIIEVDLSSLKTKARSTNCEFIYVLRYNDEPQLSKIDVTG